MKGVWRHAKVRYTTAPTTTPRALAGMLELARLFSSQSCGRDARSFSWPSVVKKKVLLGSNYYVNHPIVPLANTVTMINMDMIGRMKDNKLIVGGVGTAPDWRQAIAAANAPERMRVAVAPDSARDMPEAYSRPRLARQEVPMVTGSNGRPGSQPRV